MVERARICKGCIALGARPAARLRGPLSPFFRLAGMKPSPMNPNVCTACVAHLIPQDTRLKQRDSKKMHQPVNVTVFFADIRGYTTLSEQVTSSEMADVLSIFYDNCAEAVWAHDGVLNKFIGDAMLAWFGFPIVRPDHPAQAVECALALQSASASINRDIAALLGEGSAIEIGVGIATGDVVVGQIGQVGQDVTAIGGIVNLASRLQSAARPGEILITDAVYGFVRSRFPDAETKEYTLKGLQQPVQAYVIKQI